MRGDVCFDSAMEGGAGWVACSSVPTGIGALVEIYPAR